MGKCICFDDRVQEIPLYCNECDVDDQVLWFSPEDLETFRADSKRTIQALNACGGDEGMLDEEEYCVRGLEKGFSNYRQFRGTKIFVKNLLALQQKQRQGGKEIDATQLQLFSAACTKWARKRAIGLAALDEYDALQIFMAQIGKSSEDPFEDDPQEEYEDNVEQGFGQEYDQQYYEQDEYDQQYFDDQDQCYQSYGYVPDECAPQEQGNRAFLDEQESNDREQFVPQQSLLEDRPAYDPAIQDPTANTGKIGDLENNSKLGSPNNATMLVGMIDFIAPAGTPLPSETSSNHSKGPTRPLDVSETLSQALQLCDEAVVQ